MSVLLTVYSSYGVVFRLHSGNQHIVSMGQMPDTMLKNLCRFFIRPKEQFCEGGYEEMKGLGIRKW